MLEVWSALIMGKDGRWSAQQEAFAMGLARGLSHIEAYRQAGYNARGNHAHECASRMASNAKVRSRVAKVLAQADEMRARALMATTIVTAQTVGAMLAEAYQDARRWKQSGSQVAAAMGLAKLHGLLVDRTEDVTRRATRDPSAPKEIDVDAWVSNHVAMLTGPEPLAEPRDRLAEPRDRLAEPRSMSAFPGQLDLFPEPFDVPSNGLAEPSPFPADLGSSPKSLNEINGLGEFSDNRAPEPQKPNEIKGLDPDPGTAGTARPPVAGPPTKRRKVQKRKPRVSRLWGSKPKPKGAPPKRAKTPRKKASKTP